GARAGPWATLLAGQRSANQLWQVLAPAVGLHEKEHKADRVGVWSRHQPPECVSALGRKTHSRSLQVQPGANNLLGLTRTPLAVRDVGDGLQNAPPIEQRGRRPEVGFYGEASDQLAVGLPRECQCGDGAQFAHWEIYCSR